MNYNNSMYENFEIPQAKKKEWFVISPSPLPQFVVCGATLENKNKYNPSSLSIIFVFVSQVIRLQSLMIAAL